MGSPRVATTTRDGDNASHRARGVMRWLVAVAVLVGFLAMHGLSADHDAHLLTAVSGSHHAHPAERVETAATPGTADATLPVWRSAGANGAAHDDGCLLALTISVLTFILALIAARRAGTSRAVLLPRAGDLLPSRGPPRRAGPCLFALGVLRT